MERTDLEQYALGGPQADIGAGDGFFIAYKGDPSVSHLSYIVSDFVDLVFDYALHAEMTGRDQLKLTHRSHPSRIIC
jgi:hypothetical protein